MSRNVNAEKLRSLLPWASDLQASVIRVRSSGGSWEDVRTATGMDPANARRSLASLERRAARAGFIPDHGLTHPLPEGISLERATIQRSGGGEIERVWTKAKTDREMQIDTLLAKLDAGDTGFKKFKPTPAPKKADDDLLSLITITDFHLGMYAWDRESGENWDSDIARRVFLDAIHELVKASPSSEVGVLNQLGDFLHWDGLLAVTPQSGHVLDADTRYGQLVDLSMEVMTEAVKFMLKKYKRVHVIQAEGNHDPSGAIWMRKFMKHLFSDDPRVTVDDSEFPYYAYLHGKTMLGFHHGHKMTAKKLREFFSSEPRFRSMWGEADYTYIHCGHLHHEKVIEDSGAIVEQHPTLAARDAYAARGGWVSQRGARVVTYHKEHGETHRVTVRPANG